MKTHQYSFLENKLKTAQHDFRFLKMAVAGCGLCEVENVQRKAMGIDSGLTKKQ